MTMIFTSKTKNNENVSLLEKQRKHFRIVPHKKTKKKQYRLLIGGKETWDMG